MRAGAKFQHGAMGKAGLPRGDDFIREKRGSLIWSTRQPNGSAHLHLPLGGCLEQSFKNAIVFMKKKDRGINKTVQLSRIEDSINLTPLLSHFLKLFSFLPHSLKKYRSFF